MGVEGYGTDQALLLLKRHFKRFNAKAVVYTFIDEHVARNVNYDRRVMYRYVRMLGTKPLFALRRDGTLFLEKKPVQYDQLHYSRLWATIQVVWTCWGPKPNVDLTRALAQEMRNYVESNGAAFVVVYWHQKDSWWWNAPSTLGPRESAFQGMDFNLVNTAANPPADWRKWLIPGDEHPDARAHAYVAQLISQELHRLVGKANGHACR